MRISSGYNGEAKADDFPRLREGAVLAPADDGRWQVRWGFQEVAFLEGELFQAVLPWLSSRLAGLQSIDELTSANDLPCRVDELKDVLFELKENGLITLHPPAQLLPFVGQCTISVLGASLLAAAIAGALNPRIPQEGALADITIAPMHDVPVEDLQKLNEQILSDQTGGALMLCGAWEDRLLAGPILVPGRTACYHCFTARMNSHRAHADAYNSFEQWAGGQLPPMASGTQSPELVQLAAALVSHQVAGFLKTPCNSATAGRSLFYFPTECRMEKERVLRVPWCPHCAAVSP
ncbi:MAG: TOMM precursor leader peptide-binding protein [Candidatus Sumerlaeaceae bacterium]|nr:TOMM precursor leader peptide-binding protein [Candidatus Sumerlaeaceae bacterium]